MCNNENMQRNYEQIKFSDNTNNMNNKKSSFKRIESTVGVRSLAPLLCFESYIKTTQHLFNSAICLDSRDRVLYIYTFSIQKTLEYETQ